jgi:hypothetical protein
MKSAFLWPVVLFLMLAMSACSTLRNRTKTLGLMAGAAIVGGTVGALVAPPSDKAIAHAALWGSVAAASSGAVGLFIFDEEAKRETAEAKASKLERELAEFRSASEPQLISSSDQIGSKDLPQKLKGLVTPAKWSLYKIDRWVTSGDNELIHQDLSFQLNPSQLNPNPNFNKEPAK